MSEETNTNTNDFAVQGMFGLYSELLFAAREMPMLEMALGEHYDPSVITAVASLAVANQDFLEDLASVVREFHLATSAAWRSSSAWPVESPSST